jgi:hypothetical protein
MNQIEAARLVLNASQAIKEEPLLSYAYSEPGAGGMSPPQRDFHSNTERKRAFIAANKIGKSYAGAAEAWFHLLARHPFRDVPPPGSEGWLLCPDLQTGWKTVSKALHMLEPSDVLNPSCKYVDGIGYLYRGRKILKVSDALGGGIMIGKGCEQALLSLEGERVQWAWVDEPPKYGHFQGLRARLSMDLGPLWLTLTPVGRPVEWLKTLLEGDTDMNVEPESGWFVQHVALTIENAPHRTAEDIQAQIDECSPWEHNQRILSQWDGLTADRWVTGFSEANLFTDDLAPSQVESIGLGWDHGERPGKSVCYLTVFDGSTVWVLAEHSNTETSTPFSEAQEVKKMLEKWGVSLTDISDARGDTNSAGRFGMGFSMNEIYMRAFSKLNESSRPPFRIQVPYKRKGSVAARVRLISNACVDGRFRVHSSCSKLIHSLRHWRGENNDLKDPFDASGYIAEVYLSPALSSGSGRMLIG